jgi:hypothetical protein
MTKQEALSVTAGSPSTIFTREDVHRLINSIDIPTAPEPSMGCSCINEGFANPCKAVAPKPLTDLDIERIADDIAAYIASNAESVLDLDNAELSIDYTRHVCIDSCPVDERELSAQICDQLVALLATRGLYQESV